MGEAAARPLLITGDTQLLDELAQLASAGGVRLFSAPDVAAVHGGWSDASVVMLGLDAAPGWARSKAQFDGEVVLVAGGAADRAQLAAVAARTGAGHIAVLPQARRWLSSRLSAPPPARALVVATIGGRGGAGASILAAGLAMTGIRAGDRVLLVDADPYGGGADICLGWEQREGARWPSFAQTNGWVEPAALVQALPRQGRLAVLSFDRDPRTAVPVAAMDAALTAGRRAHDLVVIDLPRQLDEAARAAQHAADTTVLVVPAELRACAAASRVADALRESPGWLTLVVRGPSPGRLRAREIASQLRLPLAGTLRPERQLVQALERGDPPASQDGPLHTMCQRLIAAARARR
jgi:secretion/DNA translocation related CpaE-like protein